ncbi:hypothetical protein D3C87_323560 [compost metagenome]
MDNDILIKNETDLISAITAILFTPTEVGDNFIKYDKESIIYLTQAISECFEKWYNVNIDDMTLEKGIE